MSIYQGSRYTNTKTYVPRGQSRRLFTIRERPNIDLSKATYHTWKQGDTLDYLSYLVYGSSAYWWAILDANRFYQSELDIKVGDLIAIPPFTEVVKLV